VKILALGGCGEIGQKAVKTLLSLDFVKKIVIADIDKKKADHLAEKLGDKVFSVGIDISDSNSLKDVVLKTDLVMNTTGPYYLYGVKVLESCIKCGKHYFDVNDDWEPTLEMLKLHKEAKDAGITAVIGIGATPGISNLLGVKAISQLDVVKELYTGWDLDSARPERIDDKTSSAIIHGIHQMTGKIRIFTNGQFIDVKPLKKKKLNFPGIGLRSVWTIGHPEAVTFPAAYPDLTTSVNVMSTSRVNILLLKLMGFLVNLDIVSIKKAASWAQIKTCKNKTEKTPGKIISRMLKSKKVDLPPMFALASGINMNQPASVGCTILSAPKGGMAGATGVPLAVAISLFHQKKIKKKGVFTPETGILPDDFFNQLAPLCNPVKKNINDLVLTCRSWEDCDFKSHIASSVL
jgi:saccharopine dehydrogenase-like NADP-dependent oxidoreductase